MNPQKRQLFIVLVHYGEPHITRVAIEAMTAGIRQPEKIMVIDHGITPLSWPIQPGIQVLRPTSNAGYGAGMNVGLGALLGTAEALDVVVMMNNDVVVYPETLQVLMDWWEKHPQADAAGGSVEENGGVIWGGGTINPWTGRAQLHHRPGLKLAYIHGAFVAAKYRVWLGIQGWPEKQFLYWEDAVVGRRFRQRGFVLAMAEGVRVRHVESSAQRTPQQLYYLVRNGAVFCEEELPMFHRWWWQAVNRLRYLYHSLQKRSPHPVVTQALRDARQRKLGQQTL